MKPKCLLYFETTNQGYHVKQATERFLPYSVNDWYHASPLKNGRVWGNIEAARTFAEKFKKQNTQLDIRIKYDIVEEITEIWSKEEETWKNSPKN